MPTRLHLATGKLGQRYEGLEIVVCRYNEDVEWIDRFWGGIARTVYDKGEVLPGSIVLPNVGYEAHAWFHHFYENYERLAEVTLCLQGRPFDHLAGSGDLERLPKGIRKESFSFCPIGSRGGVQFRNGMPHHKGLGPDLEIVWKALLGKCPPEKWYSFYGAQFVVHRETVRKWPRELYAKGRELMTTRERACAAERIWSTLFQ